MAHQTSLSERERQVADLLLQGKSNKEIARVLGISVRTVEFHITHIFEKTGTSSRAETIVKLSEPHPVKPTGEIKKENIRESPVELQMDPQHNVEKHVDSLWRYPMKTMLFVGIGLVSILLIIFLVLPPTNKPQNVDPLQAISSQNQKNATATDNLTPTYLIPSPTLSPREVNLAEVYRLAAEYDQAVKTEIQKNKVEISTDPKSGNEIILLTGESKDRIRNLYYDLLSKIQELNQQYLALYISEIQPTPFPTKSTEQETENYYLDLQQQYPDIINQLLNEGPTVEIYEPDDGIYNKMVIGDAYAKSEIMSNAMEALFQAPKMAKVDQATQIAYIQTALGKPGLSLTFQGIEDSLANAPGISAAVYVDDAGAKYEVAIDKGLLAGIESSSHIVVPAMEVKPIETVRQIAEKFALGLSPRYTAMKNELLFEEGGKGDIYFYTWHIQNKDWSGTAWAMMPPFLQVGVAADGTIVTYIDTLDLYD